MPPGKPHRPNDFDGKGELHMKSLHTQFAIRVALLTLLTLLLVATQNTSPSLNSTASGNALRSPQAGCSNWTLQGRYALRSEASPVSGGRRLNLALLEFHGDGTYSNLGFTVNTDGVISTGTLTANYEVNANCSGQLLNPDGSVQGPIITKEDGSEFYFLRTNPANLLLVGTGTRINRSRSDEQH
jgi:hypothetical protein